MSDETVQPRMNLRRTVGVALIVGVLGWLVLWFQTEPRANYDSLIYHTHALEYAGLSRAEADAQSWKIYARYADQRDVARLDALRGGEPWSTPTIAQWMGLYQMRPLYPSLVAAAYPVLGFRAPMAVSAFVTVTYIVMTALGFGLLFGYRVAALATAVALLQVNFTHWLVFLATDGLAMLLWAALLTALALHARSGHRGWLGAIVLAVLALGLTRPNSSLAPLVPLACMLAATAGRNPIRHRFGAATIAAAAPAVGVLAWQSLAGYPGLSDVLQEIPTRHLALPPIDDPIGYTIRLNQWAIPNRLLPTLFGQPLLLATVAAGVAGLLVRRSWTAAPYLAAALIVPVAWMIHPVWYDAGRIMAPVWVSLNLGVALFAEWALVRWREPIRRATSWATRPAEEARGSD